MAKHRRLGREGATLTSRHLSRDFSSPRERFRGARYAVWSEPTPEAARLTEALLERMLLMLAPLLETMLFGKFFVIQVADFLGQMALMRPGLMLPRLHTQLDGEFERMCEAHRIICSLRLANHMLPASIGLGLATEADKRAFRPWVIDMLPKLLKCEWGMLL